MSNHLFRCLAVALLLFAAVSLPAQRIDSLIVQTAITKLKHAREYTLKVADLMPEDKYSFKPVPEEMSFTEQLTHLATNLGWLSSSYIGQGTNPVTKADGKLTQKAAIKTVLEKAYDYALNTLQSIDPAHLRDTVSFFAGPMTKLEILTLLNDHQTHHRAQMLVYLRLNGIKPPSYVGW